MAHAYAYVRGRVLTLCTTVSSSAGTRPHVLTLERSRKLLGAAVVVLRATAKPWYHGYLASSPWRVRRELSRQRGGASFWSRAMSTHHAACAGTDYECREAMSLPDEARNRAKSADRDDYCSDDAS